MDNVKGVKSKIRCSSRVQRLPMLTKILSGLLNFQLW